MKLKEVYEKLEQGVEQYFTSDEYSQLLRTMSKFHSYSWHNSLLILCQCPEATHVAGYRAWQYHFHRAVRKGETAIRIISPITVKNTTPDGKEEKKRIFRPSCVFDISQTEPIPQLEPVQIGIGELEGDIDNYRTIIQSLITLSPVPVSFTLDLSVNGCYNDSDKSISIKDGMPPRQTVKTLIHEIGHAFAHTKEQLNDLPRTREIIETEAESIAFIVCDSLGIDTSDYSFPYISTWARDDHKKILKSSMKTIQRTADHIIRKLHTK